MVDTPAYTFSLGYGEQEELAVEGDGIQRGTFRFVLAVMVMLTIAIVITVQLALMIGHEAQLSNALSWAGPSAARVAHEEGMKKLSEYALIDAQTRTYRIPIERAMALEVAESRKE